MAFAQTRRCESAHGEDTYEATLDPRWKVTASWREEGDPDRRGGVKVLPAGNPGGSLLRSLELPMHRAAGADPEMDLVYLLARAFAFGPGRRAQPQRDISGLHGFTDRPRQVLAEPLQVGLVP